MMDLLKLELSDLKTKIDDYLSLWKRQSNLSQAHVVDALLDIRNGLCQAQEIVG